MCRVAKRAISVSESTKISKRELSEIKRDAEALANKLILEYGLTSYSFKFNNNKSRMGVCRFDKKQIEVSAFFLKWGYTWEKVEDTIRHEVAHAVSYKRYGNKGGGHGRLWKKTAVELGANPRSCEKAGITLPDAAYKWIVECKDCGTRFRYHRKPKVAKHPTKYSHGDCSKGCFKVVKRYPR